MLAMLVAFVVAAAIAAAAWAKGSLSRSGALAATVVGTAVFGCGGWGWGALLLAFFLSSSLLSRLQGARKRAAVAKAEKGGRRDWAQVLANGGIAAALAIASALFPGPGWWWAFVGAMAAVTADTWATEIGTLSAARPRSIVSLQPVEPGLSGGVTVAGLAASVAGGAAIGGTAALVECLGGGAGGGIGAGVGAAAVLPAFLLANGAVAGLAGSLADSLAGATLQALLRCEVCGALTEVERHCARPTILVRGHRAFGNDAVNVLASAVGAGVGVLACLFLAF